MTPQRRTSTGTIECPDFASVPELSQIERSLIMSYVRLSKAGRDVRPEALMCDSDADCVWAGETIFNFQISRLSRLREAAADEDLKACLATRIQCLQEAWARKVTGATSEEDGDESRDYIIRDSFLFTHYPDWREESEPATSGTTRSDAAVGSAIAPSMGPAAIDGGDGACFITLSPSPGAPAALPKATALGMAYTIPETPDLERAGSLPCSISSDSAVRLSSRSLMLLPATPRPLPFRSSAHLLVNMYDQHPC